MALAQDDLQRIGRPTMPYYSVVEGEGIAGPVTVVSAETTALSSCMGLVFYNPSRAFAGLYHCGAGTLHEPLVQTTILAMINDLQPERIYLTGAARTHAGTGSTRDEKNDIEVFFYEHASAAGLKWMPDRTFSNYRLVDGNFAVNDGNDVGDGVRPPSILMATQLPTARGRSVARNIHGNIMFYGGTRPGRRLIDAPADDTVLLAFRGTTRRNVFG
jgi:hypothetical protein